jgi:hypothetical protein
MIIGITGKIGSGKDTVAQITQKLDPARNWQNKKLSSKVKQIAYLLTGFVDQDSHEGKSHYLTDWGMTIREIQQKIGTDAIRNGLHENAWVFSLFSEYTPSANWLITDIRFPNEVTELAKRGFSVYRVIRDNNPFPQSTHVSEMALDKASLPAIPNNGSIKDLEEYIRVNVIGLRL